jgi:hypothetical protein
MLQANRSYWISRGLAALKDNAHVRADAIHDLGSEIRDALTFFGRSAGFAAVDGARSSGLAKSDAASDLLIQLIQVSLEAIDCLEIADSILVAAGIHSKETTRV